MMGSQLIGNRARLADNLLVTKHLRIKPWEIKKMTKNNIKLLQNF